jgi:hypothetical protein
MDEPLAKINQLNGHLSNDYYYRQHDNICAGRFFQNQRHIRKQLQINDLHVFASPVFCLLKPAASLDFTADRAVGRNPTT